MLFQKVKLLFGQRNWRFSAVNINIANIHLSRHEKYIGNGMKGNVTYCNIYKCCGKNIKTALII